MSARQQVNQIIKTTVPCAHHSLEPQPSVCTAFSLSRNWSIDLSVICWSRFSQQVRSLSFRSSKLEIGYTLCCRALIQRSQPGSSPGCWGGGIQTVQWSSARYAAGTRPGPDHPWGWWGWSLRARAPIGARTARYNENLQSSSTLGL